MKKLYVLLTFMGYISSSCAASSPAHTSHHFDDCDQKLSRDGQTTVVAVPMPSDTNVDITAAENVRTWLGALMTPKGSPATSPTAAVTTSLAHVTKPLLSSDGRHAPNNMRGSEPTDETIAVPISEYGDASSQKIAELRLYCPTTCADSGTLNPLTSNQLKTSFDALSAGQSFYATFKPYVYLKPDKDADQGVSILDAFEWVANARAWGKWWLNIWAWWDPSRYSLDENDRIEWDDSTASVNVNIRSLKDIGYLQSQLHQFLLDGWGARYAPYIVPATRERFEEAVRLRFEKIEKLALEAAGFQEVTLGTRINLTTQRLEYYVQGLK
jgi:hypothetical protein